MNADVIHDSDGGFHVRKTECSGPNFIHIDDHIKRQEENEEAPTDGK